MTDTATGGKFATDTAHVDTTAPDRSIDITKDVCPMTFVRTRLALDDMPAGTVLAIRLYGVEPQRNVPAMARRQGHEIVSEQHAADGTMTLLVRKKRG